MNSLGVRGRSDKTRWPSGLASTHCAPGGVLPSSSFDSYTNPTSQVHCYVNPFTESGCRLSVMKGGLEVKMPGSNRFHKPVLFVPQPVSGGASWGSGEGGPL